jgi:hypothetical protein
VPGKVFLRPTASDASRADVLAEAFKVDLQGARIVGALSQSDQNRSGKFGLSSTHDYPEDRMPHRGKRSRFIRVIAPLVGTLIVLAGCGNASESKQPTVPKQSPTGVKPKPRARRHLTTAQRSRVRSILLGSVSHYTDELDEGVRIIGTTQYPSADAGLAAFDDPTSAASKFSAYQRRRNPASDLSYQDALGKADALYTADNEPQAVLTWTTDMDDMVAAFAQWVQTATSFQIQEKDATALRQAEQKVRRALGRTRHDVATIIANS